MFWADCVSPCELLKNVKNMWSRRSSRSSSWRNLGHPGGRLCSQGGVGLTQIHFLRSCALVACFRIEFVGIMLVLGSICFNCHDLSVSSWNVVVTLMTRLAAVYSSKIIEHPTKHKLRVFNALSRRSWSPPCGELLESQGWTLWTKGHVLSQMPYKSSWLSRSSELIMAYKRCLSGFRHFYLNLDLL